MMIEVYEMQVKPRALEMNIDEEIKFTAIVDYLQQISYEHANNLEVSFQQTFKKNLTWYLLRYYIEMHEYPKINDVLTVRSWVAPSDSERYSLRDYEILNESGKVLCKATTSWLLYNFIRRKPVNYLDHIADRPIHNRRSVEYDFPKLPLPDKIDETAELIVRRADLDLNRHVNNRVYLEWAIESMPKKFIEKYNISKLEISFKGQAFHKDHVLVETSIKKADNKIDDFISLSKISKMKKDELLTKAKIHWKKFK
jgi:medium-chain acyl-[acyl-carrier-protein] hydrolase